MTDNIIMKRVLLFGVLLIPFIPFIVSNSLFFPFITGKAFAFRFLTSVLTVLWLLILMNDESYRPRRSCILKSLTVFVSVIFVANIFGENISNSFFSRFERMEGFVTLFNLYLLFLVLTSTLKTVKDWRWFWNISIIASVIMAGYGFLQLNGLITIHQGGVRLDGTLGNAIYMAVYMLFHIFITLKYAFIERKDKIKLGLYGVAVILQSVMLFYTATRGAILGVIGGMLITATLISIFERHHTAVRKASRILIVVIIVGVLGFVVVKDSSFVRNNHVLNRFASISFSERTIQSRSLIWKSAWNGFKDHPILGHGQGNFNYVFNKYYVPELHPQEPWFDRAHNVVLDWLVAGGMLGLLAYLSLFASALYLIWTRSEWSVVEKSLYTGLLAAYGAHSLTVFDQTISYIMFIAVLAQIHVLSSRHDNETFSYPEKNTRLAVGSILIILVIVGFWKTNANAYFQAKTLVKALPIVVQNPNGGVASPYKEGPIKNLEYYKEILSRNSYGNLETRQQLINSTMTILRLDAPEDLKIAYVELVISEMTKQIQDDPENAAHYFLFGQFLVNIGQSQNALVVIKKGEELSPGKQDFLILETQALLQMEKKDEALAVIKRAYEMSETNDRVWVAYATVAKRNGDEKLFSDLLNKEIENKNFERIVPLMQLQVNDDQNDLEPRKLLVQVLLMAGRYDDALSVINKAKKEIEGSENAFVEFEHEINSIKQKQKIGN